MSENQPLTEDADHWKSMWKLESDDAANLRTENTQLLARLTECESVRSEWCAEFVKARNALKEIFDATDPYADGVIDASAHDKLANEIACIARPWKDTE